MSLVVDGERSGGVALVERVLTRDNGGRLVPANVPSFLSSEVSFRIRPMTMKDVDFYVAKASDKTYIADADVIASESATKVRTYTIADRQYSKTELSEERNSSIVAALDADVPLFSVLTISFENGRQITIHRTHDRASDYLDKVSVQFGSPRQGDESYLPDSARFLAAARKQLETRTVSQIATAFTPELQRHYDLREAALARLETLTAKFAENLEAERQRRDALFDQRIKELDDQLAIRRSECDAEIAEKRKRLDEDQRAWKDVFDGLQKEIDAKEKALAVQEEKFSRKAIYRDMSEKFKQNQTRFSLTSGTTRQRWPVHVFITLMLVASATSIVICFRQAVAITADDIDFYLWLLVGRFAVSAIALGTTAVYYAKWMANWFQRLANEEFRNRRMELDLDRANWFAELAFQWKERNNEVIPGELITSLTRDLFVASGEEKAPRHPIDLLDGGLKKVEITPKGATLHAGVSKKKDRS